MKLITLMVRMYFSLSQLHTFGSQHLSIQYLDNSELNSHLHLPNKLIERVKILIWHCSCSEYKVKSC